MAHVWRLASKAAMRREGVKGEAGADDPSASGGKAKGRTEGGKTLKTEAGI